MTGCWLQIIWWGWGKSKDKTKLAMLLLSRFSRLRLCVTPESAPTRLPRPSDSPGKNTGVGCHFLLQSKKVKVKLLSHIRPYHPPTRCLCPWDFPGKSTGVGCHCLLQNWPWVSNYWSWVMGTWGVILFSIFMYLWNFCNKVFKNLHQLLNALRVKLQELVLIQQDPYDLIPAHHSQIASSTSSAQ